MTNAFPQLVLGVFGLFFLYTGVTSFLRPHTFAEMLSLEANGHSGRVEIRAQYGGFFFAAALSQFAPFAGLLTMSQALVVALVIFGGLILGRIGALFANPRNERLTQMIKTLYVIDGVGLALSAAALAVA